MLNGTFRKLLKDVPNVSFAPVHKFRRRNCSPSKFVMGVFSKEIQKARQMAKRNRSAVACARCKKAKSKCSDSRPCKHCVNLKVPCDEPSNLFPSKSSSMAGLEFMNCSQPRSIHVEKMPCWDTSGQKISASEDTKSRNDCGYTPAKSSLSHAFGQDMPPAQAYGVDLFPSFPGISWPSLTKVMSPIPPYSVPSIQRHQPAPINLPPAVAALLMGVLLPPISYLTPLARASLFPLSADLLPAVPPAARLT
jgi:hypothetical protein